MSRLSILIHHISTVRHKVKLDRATQHDLRVSSNNERIHVFLLEPLGSLNVGSVARAMSNLGFSHLHLIAPRNYHFEKAAKTACWATDVLEKIQVHDTLGEALSEMNDVVGFTSSPKNIILSFNNLEKIS